MDGASGPYSDHLPEAVVVKLVEGGHGDETAPCRTQRIEHLQTRFNPHLTDILTNARSSVCSILNLGIGSTGLYCFHLIWLHALCVCVCVCACVCVCVCVCEFV